MLVPMLALALSAAPAALPFPSGERMEFAVHYLGLHVGKARIFVGHPEGPILPVFLESRTAGIVKIVDVRQQLATHLVVDTLLPRAASLDAHEAGYHHTDTTLFDRATGKATVREKGKFDNTYVIDVPEDTLDFVALVFRLRTLPLAPGMRNDFHVLAGRDVRKITAEVTARERVETGAGTFSTVKVRVPTGFTGQFSEKRPTYVWFTDDERRVVVQIQTEFAIGRATASLTSYEPGDVSAPRAPPAQVSTPDPSGDGAEPHRAGEVSEPDQAGDASAPEGSRTRSADASPAAASTASTASAGR